MRRSKVLAGVTVLVLGAAAAGALLLRRDSSAVYDETAALRDFRTAATPSAEPEQSRASVTPGVYRYATAGFEEVDALGGSRHDYPATTTITYRRVDCGTEERWQPLEHRFSANVVCAGASGVELRSTLQERTFFGAAQRQELLCDGGVTYLPRTTDVSATWDGGCAGPDTKVELRGRLLGLEQLPVAGEQVEVVHLVLETTVSGRTTGTMRRELWLQQETGLVVRAVSSTATEADGLAGKTRYREQYSVQLQSLEPAV